ncbi:hypothetical protein JH06_4285 [Blastocystis sp. subtype 4]|uniref:hypothetical protein n=1 Tax=Blastocystis sp. subtype 4 TaxID=944170 RepID=UPI00071196AF|nr:hypothetical protein JH06_4285 [Blastocystis sp. subtype 4]KNB42141.1 hypothetical protein JH06_4285 [Blastocystis sp. subtype 4]|eukprot:XP_014525584.1 hypothetical protein JH06_4285 [Blastocystis sp. subtype 4]
MYGEEVDPDLPNSLISGVVLLTIVEKYLPNLKTVGKWHRNAAPMSFQARDNIRAFANACVELGMRRADVCNYSNFEKGDLKQITATLCAFAKLGIPKGLNKVSENLEQYIENAYSDRLIGMDAVEEEEEIKLTDQEIAELERKREEEEKKRQEEERQREEEERKRQEEEERQRQEEEERQRQEEERKRQEEERIRAIEASLADDFEEGKKVFNEHYHNAVNVICSDLVDVDVLSVTSSSSSSSSEQESAKLKTTESKPRTAMEIQEMISSASNELDSALNVLDQLQAKREAALQEGANVSNVDKTIEELLAKTHELENMISKEEEVYARVAMEERLREEEEERLRREAEEEAERKRLEEEEAERKRLEEEEAERKRQEEIEQKRIMEAERLREEAERKRLEEEEAERKRQEEEAEKKRQEEEAEKKRQEEEEAERVRLELEKQHQEEEERIRREEEEAAKKCKGCRNRRSKDASIDDDDE